MPFLNEFELTVAVSFSDRWQHDKFHVGLLTPEKEEDAKAFGSHWSKIRSERSKERDRRSRSSSGSRRSRLDILKLTS